MFSTKGIGNAIKNFPQIIEGITNSLKSKDDKVHAVSEARIDICKGCDQYYLDQGMNKYRCRNCGCVIKYKTHCMSCSCPLSKWDKVLSIEQTEQELEQFKK